MRRRDLIALVGATSIARPLDVRAQQPAMPVVGYLGTSTLEATPFLSALHAGLKESGYVEGRDVAFAYRWAERHYERLPALAAELAALKVAVIVAPSNLAALAARNTTRTIPIVFFVTDPVAFGLVASLSRPGGNATGVDLLQIDLIPKRLELLRELLPNARSAGFIFQPGNPNSAKVLSSVQGAASIVGFDMQVLEARTESEIEQAFTRLAERRAEALFVTADPIFYVQRERIVVLAARLAIPALYVDSVFVAAGGLISYGASIRELLRVLGVGKILAGAKPADLPVQQPTKVELAINLKTAKTLGLTIPPAILARADEVIE